MASRTFAGLGLVALLALAGCTPGEPAVAVNDRVAAEDRTEAAPEEGGEGGGGEPAGPVSSWAAGIQLVYTEVPESLPVGPVTFELTCDALVHDVTLEGVNGEDPVVICEGGDTAVGDPVEIEAGDYTYYCSVPGHREAGMEGEITAA
jgi:plastocyanin